MICCAISFPRVQIFWGLKRLNWYPFTWGKKGSATSAKSSDRPESIPLDGQPRWYQSTAKHNFGKSSTKDHQLTATAYRNGYCKSAIGMTLSSDPQYDNTVDLSISSAKHAKIYLNKDQSKTERCMSAYSLVAGSVTRLLPNDDAGQTDDDGMDMEDEEGEESLSSHITIGDETVEEVLNMELIPRDVEEASDASDNMIATFPKAE